MAYSIKWTSSALGDVRSLPRDVVQRLTAAVARLAETPYPPGCVKLAGSVHAYRIRVGDYRV